MTSLIPYICDSNIDAIAFQSCGNYTLSGKAIVDNKASIELCSIYKEVLFNLGSKLLTTKSNIPYIVGAIGNDGELMNLDYEDLKKKNFSTLIISCPTKSKIKDSINIELFKQSIAVIEDYMDAFNLSRIVIAAQKIECSDRIVFI